MQSALAFWLLTALTLTLSSFATAQQPKQTFRIGIMLSGSPSSNASRIGALRDGLRELGYVERENIIVDYRFAEGKMDRFPALAAELVRLKPDVLVTSGSPGIRALIKATDNIPIVMAAIGCRWEWLR